MKRIVLLGATLTLATSIIYAQTGMASQPNYINSNYSIRNRDIYGPNTKTLNVVDSASLQVYCTLSKVFKDDREKCFVNVGGNQAAVDLTSINQTLQYHGSEIDALKNRPTSTGSAGSTIVKYINTGLKGSTGSAGKDGRSIVGTVQNPDGSITFTYSDGGTFTTKPIVGTTTIINNNTGYGIPQNGWVGGNYSFVQQGVGPQGPAGAAGAPGAAGQNGVGIASITQTATGTIFAMTDGTKTFWPNIFENSTTTNALITNANVTNSTTTNGFVVNGVFTNSTTTNSFVDSLTVNKVYGNFVENDLIISTTSNKIQVGAPLIRNTDTAMSGFNRTFTGNGNFGIGTLSPNEKLTVYGNVQVRNQDILKWGSNGEANVGTDNNAIFGAYNIATGTRSLALGTQNDAWAEDSTAVGVANQSLGDYSSTFGRFNIATGTVAIAIGSSNRIFANAAGAFGASNTISGVESYSFGNENNITGATSIAIGQGNKVSANNSGATGYYNTVLSAYSYAFGASNIASGTATGSYTIGSNITNDVASSTMIGTSNNTKLFIGADGFVGIASTTGARITRVADEQLRVGGKIRAQGFVTDVAADLAENFPADEASIEPGNLVEFSNVMHNWNTGANKESNFEINGVIKALSAKKVIGVVATNPGIILGGDTKGVPVAFSGRVPVKVSNENGPIIKGDRITLSATQPGVGSKLMNAGQSVGVALSNDTGKGVVLMLVKNEYVYDPTLLLESNTDTKVGNTGVSNPEKKLCIDDVCLDKSLLQKIINFFTSLTGGTPVDNSIKKVESTTTQTFDYSTTTNVDQKSTDTPKLEPATSSPAVPTTPTTSATTTNENTNG